MKNGQRIYLVINKEITEGKVGAFNEKFVQVRIKGHNVGCIYKDGLFYKYGFARGERCLFLQKKWHYVFALICEKIRNL